MKKIITLAIVLAATTLLAHAQSNTQKEVKGTTSPVPAESVTNNPLYKPDNNSGVNPLAKTSGSPIGGIVVKGGRNGLQAVDSPDSTVKTATTGAQKSAGNPIGGIIVKSEKSINEKGIK
ncbi:hypothetical protein HQ865_15955 [Mucilaginibacter mali]|uniref:Uncharacterized protein n=1 Tax=Mucilaginibacter mali TaxID=2740462 RepID=A0A7D4Q2B5_9SPHI|nr:hypothetical protein [Mucilaginibacter mali]QKJ31186.1 hypothetical protein HQ865_15955 [Mucilaginibacter mali]